MKIVNFSFQVFPVADIHDMTENKSSLWVIFPIEFSLIFILLNVFDVEIPDWINRTRNVNQH